MSAEIPTHSRYDDTPYDTFVDDNGDVSLPPDAGAVITDEFMYARDKERLDKWERKAQQEQEQADLEALDTTRYIPEVVIGPSVRLDQRSLALSAMKRRFAEFAQADGLMKASADPKTRPELRRRVANLDLRAKQKLRRTKSAISQSQQEHVLEPILQSDALLAAGFPTHEVDTAMQQTIMSVRGDFGPKVGNVARNRNARRINPGTTEKE